MKSDRNESAPRHTRDDCREGSVSDKRNEQCASEHPPEILDAVVRADVIAHWFDDVVTAEDEKIKNEAEPERPNFVCFYVNDFGEDAFHQKVLSSRALARGPHKYGNFTRVERSFAALTMTTRVVSSTRLALRLRVPV